MQNRLSRKRWLEMLACAFILPHCKGISFTRRISLSRVGRYHPNSFAPPGTKNGENMRLRELIDDLVNALNKVIAKITLLTGEDFND